MDTSSISAVMSALFLQVWLPAWRRCYRPSSVCQGKPKSFSTGLRAGSVRIRPLGESAKAHSIPLAITVVCLRAFATCCTVNCKLFKVLGRDAITRARDSLFRLNFVQHLTTRKMARIWTERACCSRVARHFSPLDVDLRIYIYHQMDLSHRLCQVADLHTYPHPSSVLGTGAGPQHLTESTPPRSRHQPPLFKASSCRTPEYPLRLQQAEFRQSGLLLV